MAQFPSPEHLVPSAKLSPQTRQSGARARAGKVGESNPYLKSALSEAVASAASTNSFLGERYRRLAKRRGKQRAMVAVARSTLVVIWHLLSDHYAHFTDLGPGYYQHRVDKERKARDLVRQLQALGHK